MLGKRLVELRKKKGMTQEEVAKKIHLTRSTYAQYEVDRRVPEYATLQKLADFFEVSIDYLVGRDKPDEESKTSLTQKQSEHVIKRMVEHYNIDVSDPENVKKLEQIIQLVFPPSKP